eukprot:1859308-Amphidinium_carterae.1
MRTQVQEAQTYRQEITTYMAEAAQLSQNLQHMTQLNEHSGQAQATSDWTLRTELQAANRELSLSESREVTNLTNLARAVGALALAWFRRSRFQWMPGTQTGGGTLLGAGQGCVRETNAQVQLGG